jgi:hypothetical protein
MLIDLHAKSDLSSGVSVSAAQVLSRAKESGLNGVAFCETLTTRRCQDVLELAEREFPELAVFIGVEIPTERGILLGFVPEVDNFYLAEEWRWLAYKTTPSAEAVIDLFEAQNGVVIAARPYDLSIPFNMGDYIFAFDRLGAVEAYSPRVGALQNNFALEAATFMGLGTVGGSDPLDDPSVVGQFATFFEEDFKTQRQLVDALRQSEFWAVQIGDKPQRKTSKPDDSRRGTGDGNRRSGSRGGRSRSGSRGGRRGSRR